MLEKADKEGDCLDIGGTAFKITFSDKSKLEKDYWIPRKSFKKLFVQIKKLLPRVESVPVVLGGSEDNENE